MSLRGGSAIVGIGQAGLGEAPGRSAMELLGEASLDALEDAGIPLQQVDGLFASTMNHSMPALSAAEYLGIQPRFVESTLFGGSSFECYVLAAAMALELRLCDVALIAYGSNQRTASGKLVTMSTLEPYEAPYAPRYPISGYALAASRHMHQYGTTREQLAEVAVAARAWAGLNPEAFMREPITIDDVLTSRMISDPLTLLDCCLVTDGAGACVMVRADRARDTPKPPAYMLGAAYALWHRQISAMPDLTVTAASRSGPQAFQMAGLSPQDVDVAELYDAFTINTILFLEDLGFCPKGEGGNYVAGGAIAPGGRFPVNTYGGGLSCVHPGMLGMFLLVEAVRQLRGEAGPRQVPGAQVAVAHGNGGVLSSQSTVILGGAGTL